MTGAAEPASRRLQRDVTLRGNHCAGAYLEVELQLSSEIADGTTRVSPVVYDMSVTHRCPAHIT